MRLNQAIAIAGVIGMLGVCHVADPALAQGAPEAGAGGADAPSLRLGGHSVGGFLETRAARLEALAAAQNSQGLTGNAEDAVSRALLDVATFYLARGFIREGRDIAETLAQATMSPAMEAQRDLLSAALAVLDPLWQGDIADAVATLETASGGAARVFEAYGLQRLQDADGAAAVLSNSERSFDAMPPALVERTLPLLLEAAVAAEDWTLARGLAERMRAIHEDGEGALPYLVGLVALGGGQDLVAFEQFVEASAARDVWAHRARLQIVRLGLHYQAIDHDEALSMLARADALWRGDEDALETLLDIERVATDAGNWKAAAIALGTLMTRYPDTLAAEEARPRALSHLQQFYATGINGEIDFDRFISGHREVSALFRFTPGFEQASAAFADFLVAVGATAAAAQEYRLTREYMEAGAELGLREPNPVQLDRLVLREAEMHLVSGRMGAAELLLGQRLRSGDAALHARRQQLRERYVALTGEQITQGDVDPGGSAEMLRVAARAHIANRAWHSARDTFVELWRLVGDDLPPADAIGLLVAAERSGDTHLAETIAPLLSEQSEALSRVVPAGAAPNASGPHLGAESASALLDRADEALERAGMIVDDVLGDPAGAGDQMEEQ
jgi:tetratricopeptide (TPR) repeat protein